MGHDERRGDVTPVLTVGAVAAHLGVAVSTLRSWNRRYGLGPSQHQAGRHRRYDHLDLARLESMRTLVHSGVSPADAARWVLREPVDVASAPDQSGGSPSRVLAGLVKAAYRFDPLVLVNDISRQLSTRGVRSAWEDVCLPLIRHVSGDDTDCRDVEHLVSWTISVALHRVADVARRPGVPSVLLACAEGEGHTLGLDALRAALAERGVSVRMLGASVSDATLHRAIGRSDPAAVVLWSQAGRTARPSALTRIGGITPRETLVVAAGPGWPARRPPPGAVTAQTLREAVLLIIGAVSQSTGPDPRPVRSGARPTPTRAAGG